MKHITRSFTVAVAVALSFGVLSAYAAAPSGYYSSLNGISDPEQLKDAVFALCSPHTHPTDSKAYSAYYSSLPTFFRETDVYPQSAGSDKAGAYWDMYSNIITREWSGSVFNREHSFPKSWWGGSTTVPAYVDLFHLYPGEAAANMKKSNYPLGVVNMSETVAFDNGVSKVGYAVSGQGGGAKYVFEPADEYKGDFARTYFYMTTIYQDMTWNTSYLFMLFQNEYPTLKPWAYEMLLEWAAKDPVSQKELDRVEAVYQIQNNRNPFIDLPELAEYIWGSKKGQEFKVETGGSSNPGVTDPTLFAPVDGMALDFGQCAVSGSTNRSLLFTGANLTGSISVLVTGTDRKQFSIETTSIPASRVNTEGGTYLTVTYAPTATGSHTANITVYDVDGWPAGKSINVVLKGEGVDKPSLQKITALPATDVTSTSYTANWKVPTGDVIDYYQVNRTHIVDGKTVTDQLIAEDNSLTIDDFNPNVDDYYTVQSVRLGYLSPISNTIYVSNAGLQGVESEQPLAVEAYPDGIRLICGDTQTNLRVIDITGRVFVTIDSIERNTELTLPTGVYMIVTDQHRTPVKLLVR